MQSVEIMQPVKPQAGSRALDRPQPGPGTYQPPRHSHARRTIEAGRSGVRSGGVWHLLSGVAETALDLVLPRTCPGCFAPEPWCASCAASIAGRPKAVEPPDALLDGFARADAPAPSLHALSRYTGPARAAVIAGKERGRRDLPLLLGAALGLGIARLQDSGALPADLWLVPAPTRRSAARARGGDPVTAMARTAARLLAGRGRATGLAACLFSGRGARDSVGLDPAARAANLAHAIRFDSRAAPPTGAQILLLDDVLTSGATVLHSSLALRRRGLAPIGALVVTSVPPLRAAMIRKEAAADP